MFQEYNYHYSHITYLKTLHECNHCSCNVIQVTDTELSHIVSMSVSFPEPLTYRGVLLSTLLQDILRPSNHLLNVLLQAANKLDLSNKH
jgi:hypothetical protein